MKAIFENGSFINKYDVDKLNVSALHLILNVIGESSNWEELMLNLDKTKHKFLRANLAYKFSHYSTKDGVEIYFEGQKERMIFVPCKTDIEI